MALKGICCAARFAATTSGPNSISEIIATRCQCRSNQPLRTHMMALVRPKPSMARLTTSEPKCAQLPTENKRMMPICSAITAPATRPTDRYREAVGRSSTPAAGGSVPCGVIGPALKVRTRRAVES